MLDLRLSVYNACARARVFACINTCECSEFGDTLRATYTYYTRSNGATPTLLGKAEAHTNSPHRVTYYVVTTFN